jgi:hydroxypyruvate reductase
MRNAPRIPRDLRVDAEKIWWAGVAAIAPGPLIRAHLHVDRNTLLVGSESIDLTAVERIAIVGAGKAAGALAVALENLLGPRLLAEKHVVGWVNVPADCILPTQRVRLHAGRPAAVNEPCPDGVAGTRRILEIVSSLNPRDLCFCLLTGGGSALLPAPVPEIALEDKLHVTRLLSAAGANIEQLNTVRRHLSLVKGGGLARACRAGRLITLAISDVLGDPPETIASGPTWPGATTADDALAVLEDFGLTRLPQLGAIVRCLRQRGRDSFATGDNSKKPVFPVAKESRPRSFPLPGRANVPLPSFKNNRSRKVSSFGSHSIPPLTNNKSRSSSPSASNSNVPISSTSRSSPHGGKRSCSNDHFPWP